MARFQLDEDLIIRNRDRLPTLAGVLNEVERRRREGEDVAVFLNDSRIAVEPFSTVGAIVSASGR